MANYWMVRSDEHFQHLVEEGEFVAIGFSAAELGTISGLTKEQITERVRRLRTGDKPRSIDSEAGNLFRFADGIRIGDWVLTAVPGNNILVGLIASVYTFDVSRPGNPHQRKVKWVGKVSRERLSDSLRNSLGSQLTVFSVDKHADEIRQVVEA